MASVPVDVSRAMEDEDGAVVQRPLNLVMPVDFAQLGKLKDLLRLPHVAPLSEAALDRVATVHSTRFVILEDQEQEWAKLCVIATYDGSFEAYIGAFARELNELFDKLLQLVTDGGAQYVPVQQHVGELTKYLWEHNVPPANGRMYRAYPDLKVLDISQPSHPRRDPTPAPSELDLDDIQGIVIRGYRKDLARHLVLRIDEPAGFKEMLGNLADEDLATGPFITVASDWTDKPPNLDGPSPRCVNIGFTFDGLKALGLSDESLDSFPQEFREGAAARAEEHAYERGPSAPEHWMEWLRSADTHAIVSLYAENDEQLAIIDGGIREMAAGAATAIEHFDAHRLDGTDTEHFGYADGLSQPTIAGVEPRTGLRDPFPPVPAGEFILGHPTYAGPPRTPLPMPAKLGHNGSFAAFRVMEQDVDSFERFLATESRRAGIDPELLAAKLCGRWRNGEPLVMRPPDVPAGTIARENLNAFDYEATRAFPGGDHDGLICPHGAHIRRAFPRSQRVVDDGDGFRRRIIRRGMPYGPRYNPADPTADERGIVGMFICASLRDQFEYVMREWLNDGLFTGGRLGRSKDPLTGANDESDSRFVAPGSPYADATGFPRFVTTRGCVYLFLPSMTALRHMAGAAT